MTTDQRKTVLPANVGTVRCESGYLALGDPGYVWNNHSDDAVNGFYLAPELRDLEDYVRAAEEAGKHVRGYDMHNTTAAGLIFRAPVGNHYVITDGEDHEVYTVTIRWDGIAEPLNFNDGIHIIEDLDVDSATMAVHDPTLTLTGKNGPHFTDWEAMTARKRDLESGNVPEAFVEGEPQMRYSAKSHRTVYDLDSTGLMAMFPTYDGDGIFDVAVHLDDQGNMFAVQVEFFDIEAYYAGEGADDAWEDE